MNQTCLRAVARPVALAAALALLGASAWADPPARVGRVAWIAGDVSLSPHAGDAPVGAALNWPVTSGNVLVTSPSGRAEITIGPTAIDLDVDTAVDVEQLDDDQMRLRVERGSVAVRAANAKDASMLAVQTPLGRFTQQQPGNWRVDVRGSAVDGTALRGRIGFVSNDGATYTFVDGQRAHLVPDANGLAMTLLGAAGDDFQHFAQARAGASSSSMSQRYVPPTMTGADTLDSYGQWTSSPEYGNVWVPRVAADWAPYRYGHWAWVSPWGWTWVDDAPWGFAPFHYGRWALWGGRWAWVPGAYVARPVYAPALVAWTSPLPPAPGVSVSIGISSGFSAGVSWVPLAPHEVYVPPYRVSNTYVRNVNITHVTNVTEINNVVRVVNAQGPQHPQGTALPGRPLALAGNPRAETAVQARVMQAHQPVFQHLAPAMVHEPATARMRAPQSAPQPAPQGAQQPWTRADSHPASVHPPMAQPHRFDDETRAQRFEPQRPPHVEPDRAMREHEQLEREPQRPQERELQREHEHEPQQGHEPQRDHHRRPHAEREEGRP